LAIVRKSILILLSNESARRDFEEFYPDQAAKARVAHFPSGLAIAEKIPRFSGNSIRHRNLPWSQISSGGTKIIVFSHQFSSFLSAAGLKSTL
jgi:hypothetical protein